MMGEVLMGYWFYLGKNAKGVTAVLAGAAMIQNACGSMVRSMCSTSTLVGARMILSWPLDAS